MPNMADEKPTNYRRNLWIPPLEWSWVVAEAKCLGISRAEVVRRAIAAYSEEGERK